MIKVYNFKYIELFLGVLREYMMSFFLDWDFGSL